ncbi:uncharacterized protein LOC110699541 isoform X2 [Chenopodium quinoa]|uniref:uncharacterized protein LOC110699541 isoform X2 n=1 Tax=Chenopodium quinoa TaxID=63459 RepID=UPI000B77D44D|nr:uncharacterized protein LOC110699541 isoform X2 [Chenopodium quinoa]
MLPTEKTPARSAADIRKANLEKKLAAQAAKKDGKQMPRSLQKQVRPPPTQQESASKVQKTADRQTTGGKSIRVPDGPGSADVLSAIPLRTATGPSEGRSGRQDNSPRWPDGAQYARAMLKAVPRDEKEAIPGINSFNADRVLVDLADAMLRVEGLKRAYTRKSEEAEKTKALQQQIDQLKNQVDQLQASLDDANKKLEEQTELLQRLSKAETENGRLAKENERLRKEAAAANENFKATLESEQERLIEENEHDCANRMQRAFSLIHPEADFTVWELAFKYSDLAILAEEANEPGPGPYDAWVREEIARR